MFFLPTGVLQVCTLQGGPISNMKLTVLTLYVLLSVLNGDPVQQRLFLLLNPLFVIIPYLYESCFHLFDFY